jgi:iron complex transport system permease protein
MQALFRNPIVEPGLVGTSAGAAFGAALVFVLGKSIGAAYSDVLGAFALPVAAFAGALAATLAVYRFSALSGKVNVATMILAGVAVNAIANAGTGFMAYIARDPQARSITFWTLGTFTGADWKSATLVTTTMLLFTALALRYAKALNALLLGESDAMSLGVDVRRLNITLLVLNTVLVGTATAMVGVISFMGLVVPHLLRLIRSADNRFLIVASALLGAILMVIADTVARTLIAPAELPIGVITAFVGAPVFLWLLFRQHRDNEGKGGFYA